jgi:hypothetical protein
MRFVARVAALILLLCVWPLMPPHFGVHAAPPPNGETTYVDFEHVAVMPFFVGKRQPNIDETADKTLSCPVGVLCEGADDIDPDAGRALTRMVYDGLRMKFFEKVVSLELTRSAYDQVVVDAPSDTPRALARKLGRSLGADYVVVGTLWRYRDRGRVPASPDSAASVAFALYLVDVESGVRVWRGVFDQTQQPLTDDLFKARQSLQMGVKWLSARELTRFGVEKVLKSFPTEEKLRKPVERE